MYWLYYAVLLSWFFPVGRAVAQSLDWRLAAWAGWTFILIILFPIWTRKNAERHARKYLDLFTVEYRPPGADSGRNQLP